MMLFIFNWYFYNEQTNQNAPQSLAVKTCEFIIVLIISEILLSDMENIACMFKTTQGNQMSEPSLSFPYPELVGSELINVGSISRNRLIPEAELQKKLVPTGQQHLPSLFSVLHKLLIRDTSIR